MLTHKGYLTQNDKGNWKMYCNPALKSISSTQLVAQTCMSLGFAGYSQYNDTEIDATMLRTMNISVINDTTVDFRNSIAQEQVSFALSTEGDETVKNSNQCTALWIECVPHTNSNRTNVISDIEKSDGMFDEKRFIRPIIDLNKIPHVIVPAQNQWQTFGNEMAFSKYHWSFSAVIYVNGKAICNGVLLSSEWVAVEESCLKLHRYLEKTNFPYI